MCEVVEYHTKKKKKKLWHAYEVFRLKKKRKKKHDKKYQYLKALYILIIKFAKEWHFKTWIGVNVWGQW